MTGDVVRNQCRSMSGSTMELHGAFVETSKSPVFCADSMVVATTISSMVSSPAALRAPFSGTIGLRLVSVGDYVKEGQIVRVKVIEADEKGRVRLSMKAAAEEDAANKGGGAAEAALAMLELKRQFS